MESSINNMVNRMATILSGNNPSIYLFGSVVLDDFRLGWSDIDIICLAEEVLSEEQAQVLVGLRQTLSKEYPENVYYRLFEGGILSLSAFLNKASDRAVYWGTRGQRITDAYDLDPFAKIEIKDSGRLLFGRDFKDKISYPTENEIKSAVENHYQVIRRYARKTNRSVTSAGWLFDIARCLYTLRTGAIIAKTDAGEWAIGENLVPDTKIMKRAVEIRKNPNYYKTDEDTLNWLATLGPYIQRFADVLENQLFDK